MNMRYSVRRAGLPAALALAATVASANAQETAWQKAASEAVEPIAAELSKAFPEIARDGKADFAPLATALKAAGLGKPQTPSASNAGGPEAAAGARGGGPGGPGAGRRGGGGGGPDMSAADIEFVTSLDANRDGRVTAEEIRGAVESDLRKAFERKSSLDTDADGKISKKEYANSMPRKFGEVDEYGLDGHARGHFKREDLDDDGELSLGEVAGPVIARSAGRARAMQLASRLVAADANHDNSLSAEELRAIAGGLDGAESIWKTLGFEGDALPVANLYRSLSRLPREDAEKLDRALRQ